MTALIECAAGSLVLAGLCGALVIQSVLFKNKNREKREQPRAR